MIALAQSIKKAQMHIITHKTTLDSRRFRAFEIYINFLEQTTMLL